MSNTNDNFAGIKIVMLGNSGVGKSSLITRWINGIWQDDLRPTIGASHLRKKISLNDEEIDICIWDTAGQEQFQALTPLYTRGSMFAILTVSINDSESITSLDNWKTILNTTCDPCPPVCVAVNKIDLDQSIEKQQEIEEQLKNDYPNIFFTSAKTGESVEELFMYAVINGHKFYKTGISPASIGIESNAEKSNNKCC